MVLDESQHLEIYQLARVAQVALNNNSKAAIADVQVALERIEGVLRGARCLVFGVATIPPPSGPCDTAGRSGTQGSGKGKSSKSSGPYL